MQNAFYRSFLDENERIIAFIGGGGKTTLIQRLARDCLRARKRVVVLSQFPFFTPMEAKTFISEDPGLLSRQINTGLAETPVLYIGKAVKQSRLVSFNLTEIKTILREVESDHIFIEADSTEGCSLSGYKKVTVSLLKLADRYINVIGADAFNQAKNENWLDGEDSFWRNKTVLSPIDIGDWFAVSRVYAKINALNLPATYFINKVENIYIENMAIPLAKNFKVRGIERVITGSVFNSILHLIK